MRPSKKIVKLIENMPHPNEDGERHFEWHSADGFAFLGCAKAKLGLDYNNELEAMRERNYSLNAEHVIDGVDLTAKNDYTYELWACVEFFAQVGDMEMVRILVEIVRAIGVYYDHESYDIIGQRHCRERCRIIMPYDTSAAALALARAGDMGYASNLVESLRRRQRKNGNWDYLRLWEMEKLHQEDCHYMAMMIYHLRELQALGLDTEIMWRKALIWLIKPKPRCSFCKRADYKNNIWLCGGSLGYGVPMMYQAIKGAGIIKLRLRARKATIGCLEHPNFRVRAMAAWALAG